MYELLLGDECDNALFARLRRAIERLGGSIYERDWVVGGSQEIITYSIELPDGNLEAITETYIGLSLKGPEELVARVASETQK